MDTRHVLEVATNAYWRADPADVSVNAICQAAGVSKPSVYREFGNEDGLMRAALGGYAEQVLGDVFAILTRGDTLEATLGALVGFACEDPRMETGCLFYKMRAGKHRLGPQTLALVDELSAAAQKAYEAFLQARRDAGDWQGTEPIEDMARYLGSQLEMAITKRAAGEDPAAIRATLTLAFTVLTRR